MTETTLNIADYFTAETYTGYGLIKATNAVLHDLGFDKVLPGPMGYTYLKKGYVTGVKDVKACTGQQGAEWASKYIAKLVAKATPEGDVSNEVEMTEPLPIEV
jgi:hypothetical protein